MNTLKKQSQRLQRRRRIRSRVFGSETRPRLSIFKSNKYVYAQVINDENGTTLASANSKDMKGKSLLEQAQEVGKRIAGEATKKGVSKVVFDRSGYVYKGRVKALAESAREGGLDF